MAEPWMLKYLPRLASSFTSNVTADRRRSEREKG
jgi:hypothetical protein